eukprot:1656275-Pyramimonas_sp.AAC.1
MCSRGPTRSVRDHPALQLVTEEAAHPFEILAEAPTRFPPQTTTASGGDGADGQHRYPCTTPSTWD